MSLGKVLHLLEPQIFLSKTGILVSESKRNKAMYVKHLTPRRHPTWGDIAPIKYKMQKTPVKKLRALSSVEPKKM